MAFDCKWDLSLNPDFLPARCQCSQAQKSETKSPAVLRDRAAFQTTQRLLQFLKLFRVPFKRKQITEMCTSVWWWCLLSTVQASFESGSLGGTGLDHLKLESSALFVYPVSLKKCVCTCVWCEDGGGEVGKRDHAWLSWGTIEGAGG